jgi:NAD(P)-dependent dehydrogenase (short-subunit alcohol dehydrogenase family)
MRLVVLTGASRGLGLALARRLLGPANQLLALARRPAPELEQKAQALGADLEQWAVDLAQPAPVAERLESWLNAHAGKGFAQAVLINNAGLLGAVGPVGDVDAETLASVLRVGLEAPLLLTAAFLRATRPWPAQRRVLNVSSGAGRTAITGWAAYCAAKAGLDHLTRVIAQDEALLPNPAKIVSLGPGVIDTDMQGALRSAAAAGFPDQPRFVQLKQAGQLLAPDAAAERLLGFLERADFGARPVADVRQD